MIENKIIRRAVRLISAIHELHKQGFQNLAVFTAISGSGFHWRLSLMPFDCLYQDHSGKVNYDITESWQVAEHSSGVIGNTYFGWEDVSELSARELAETIKNRFPRLVEHCKGVNFENAGWLTYILGQAEQENLPVMYREYYKPTRGFITSTVNGSLLAPPYPVIYCINGRQFIYTQGNKLTDDDDWHRSYIKIIDAIRSSKVARFPSYPITSPNHLEFCAYWEGAIYYIVNILGFQRIDEFLLKSENVSTSSETWSSFFAIYNTHGQFIYLKAFLVRHMIHQNTKYELNNADAQKWTTWLTDFENSHAGSENFNTNLPNPFFGGNNPLHLGGILDSNGRTVEGSFFSIY